MILQFSVSLGKVVGKIARYQGKNSVVCAEFPMGSKLIFFPKENNFFPIQKLKFLKFEAMEYQNHYVKF